MKRFMIAVAAVLAIGLATADTAEAGNWRCRTSCRQVKLVRCQPVRNVFRVVHNVGCSVTSTTRAVVHGVVHGVVHNRPRIVFQRRCNTGSCSVAPAATAPAPAAVLPAAPSPPQ